MKAAPDDAPSPPPDLRVDVATLEGEEVVVFSWSTESSAALEGRGLTSAELAVARMAVAGLTDTQIAAVRGCSVRTVGKQLGAAYRKLGVCSRRELAREAARPAR